MATRAIVAAAEIEPRDAERMLRRASELGVAIVHEVAETSDQLLDLLRRNPDVEVMLADFLPDVPGSESLYAFDRADGDAVGDQSAEDAVLAAIASLRWVQLPSVGVNQEAGSVT